MSLTERVIRDAKPGPKVKHIWDDKLKGFALKVFPSGHTAYILTYRVDGRQRSATVGRPAEILLKDARERAAEMLHGVRSEGRDPLAEKQARRKAATVAEGVERFFQEYVPRRIADGRMKERTVTEYRHQARQTILPALGRMKIGKVSRGDIERAISKRPPIARNRVLALLSRLFNLFEAWELRPQHTNPCRFIEKAREEPRDRVLSDTEMTALAKALSSEAANRPAAIAAIRVAALTGLRISEVIAMEWEHIDFETGRMLLPDTKTGRRWHDLPDAAVEIIGKCRRINEWCFSTGRGSHITYKTVRSAFKECARKANLKNVRLHDLRRSFATNAATEGLSALQLQHLLGWKQAAMPARYVNLAGEATRESRRALGDKVAAIMAQGEKPKRKKRKKNKPLPIIRLPKSAA